MCSSDLGSFLFAVEGTKGAFFEDWRGATVPLMRVEGLLWEESLRGTVRTRSRGEWEPRSSKWISGREGLWKEEWERFYVW